MLEIIRYDKNSEKDILNRQKLDLTSVEESVKAIIDDVMTRGDKAAAEYTERFDGAKLDCFEVTKEEIDEALKTVGVGYIKMLEASYDNIAAFHKKQLREGFCIKGERGEIIGQRFIPVARAGIYVPGGTAAYPSTVLMNAVPAKIAGVKEVVMVTPPGRDGRVKKAEVLAAAAVCGVDRVFKIGGAQAIAALAYGTESIPKADKITGPGNIFVATAKKLVYGECGIDMFAGPSEILVIADDGANARHVAADMLSQAEHDALASAVLITPSERLASEVKDELYSQLATLPRAEIAEKSLDANGKIIITDTVEQAVELSNKLAPEHLELCVEKPFDYLDRVLNAGSVFLGYSTPEAVGDYYAGANHTLPTSGTARYASPLGVDDFVKSTQYICYTPEALRAAGGDITAFARSEGLDAHARSVEVRLK